MEMGRKPNLEIKEKIRALYEKEHRESLEQIGKQLGVSRQRVSQILRELGLEPEETRVADVSQIIDEICELGGLSRAELSFLIEVTRENISRWANGHILASASNARKLEILLNALKYARSGS
jgi:transcriptional regulator with XRE-family HTH domain